MEEIDSFVGELENVKCVVSIDDFWQLDLTPVCDVYRQAATLSREALELHSMLRQSYVHKSDILDLSLSLAAGLRGKTKARDKKSVPLMSEKEIVALLNAAMSAQGYKGKQLDMLDPELARHGDLRKRLATRQKSLVASLNKISARTRKY
jgi:hypothetical protein